MKELAAELRTIYDELHAYVQRWQDSGVEAGLEKLRASGQEIGKAWSGSWLGYHARVYYAGFKTPPPGAHFSSDWGFNAMFGEESHGDWKEMPADTVEKEIRRRAGNPDLDQARILAAQGQELLERKRSDVISILQTFSSGRGDTFIDRLAEEADKIKSVSATEAVIRILPRGGILSHDERAGCQGIRTPPHVALLADVVSLQSPMERCEDLAKLAQRAFSHVERQVKAEAKVERVGTNVFIGHGRSKEWTSLKDFIGDRMRLPHDEFNRVSVAGIPTATRLGTMLDAAAIAFLVLTAEDETADGGSGPPKRHP